MGLLWLWYEYTHHLIAVIAYLFLYAGLNMFMKKKKVYQVKLELHSTEQISAYYILSSYFLPQIFCAKAIHASYPNSLLSAFQFPFNTKSHISF